MPVGNGDVEAWNVRPVLCVLVSGAIPLAKEFLDKRSRVRRWHVPNVSITAETAEISKVLQVTVPIFGDAPSFPRLSCQPEMHLFWALAYNLRSGQMRGIV